jgi:hypothetical protein
MNEERKKFGPNLTLPFRDMGGEKLLQFIWQFGYFNSTDLTTTEGEKLSILFPGTLNKNGGPDFTAAKIRVGETTFFGNIEIHLRTSDWEKHRHQSDTQYRNVILHVVFQHDKIVNNAIPVLELEPRISTFLLERYNALMNADSFIPCSASVALVKELVWVSWKERLLVERLTRKSEYILSLLKESNDHWEETLWWLLARNFGSKVNSEAFEAIAKSISINVLAKHKSSIHQLEAILFGQAGLLNEKFEEEYPKLLQREYQYLQKKLLLQPVSIPLQFLRMRPVNFPTIRLAQLAMFAQQSSHLFSKILEAKEITEVKALFQVTANDFWHYHYTFRQISPFKKKTLGSDTTDTIIINTVIPVLFAYGVHHADEKYKEKALRWLEKIAPEKNGLTASFAQLGIKGQSAYDSQALIELKNEYCSPKKCLQCSVGNYLLKNEAIQTKAGLGSGQL